jgi:FKBP-type peptidyl-prolyl cis-trans isomerase 2
MAITKGNKIKVEYTGTLEDGSTFDTSVGKEPLEFEVGSGQLIKGFDDAVMGMEKGQEKEITLTPENAYGAVNPELSKKVPRSQLPEGPEPQAGMMLAVSLPTGQQIPAKIIAVDDTEVTIDLNHPLAGKTLKFKIKIVEC